MSGFIPLSGEEMTIDFVAGSITAPLSERLKPLQDKYLGQFGQYSDEAALAIAGSIAHKYGGQLHPAVKKVGKEVFRVAVIGAGGQAGSSMVRDLLGKFGGAKATTGSTSSMVIIG